MKNAYLIIYSLFLGMSFMVASDLFGQQSGNVRSISLPNVDVRLAEGQGRDVVERNCIMCHSLDYIPMQPKFTKAQWTATVNKMIKTFGAPVPEDDVEKIIGYLTARYGAGN